MFGLLKGCSCGMRLDERQAWMGHVCGVCLALRDHHGQIARFTTNYDAALLSVLCTAQTSVESTPIRHFCPLRRGGTLSVIASDQPGARYAAIIALLMAATKLADDVIDAEGWARVVPGLTRRVAQRWQRQAETAARSIGFPIETISHQVECQFATEDQARPEFTTLAAPTGRAVAAAFAHTAVLTDHLEHIAPLTQIGHMYGRIMYVLDSYRDYRTDRARQGFNALARCFAPSEVQQQARHIFDMAYNELARSFAALTLPQSALAQTLLLHQLIRIGQQVLALDVIDEQEAVPPADAPPAQRHRRKVHSDRNSCDCFCDPLCCDCGSGCSCCLRPGQTDSDSNDVCCCNGCGDNGGCSCCGGCCGGCEGCDCDCC